MLTKEERYIFNSPVQAISKDLDKQDKARVLWNHYTKNPWNH